MKLKKLISSVMAAVMISTSACAVSVSANGENDTASSAKTATISTEVAANGYAYVGELQNVSDIKSAEILFSATTTNGNNLAWSVEKNEDVTGNEYNSYFENNVFLAWSSKREANTPYAANLPKSTDSNGSAYIYVWSDAACTVTVNVVYKQTEINYISAEAMENKLNYTVSYNVKDECSLYTALYNKAEKLEACKINQPEGSFDVANDGEYEVKAFLWDENLKPMCAAKSKTVEITNGETENGEVIWRSTTNSDRWVDEGILTATAWDKDTAVMDENNDKYIIVDQNTRYQTLDERPWGGCFNERGWTAMSKLTDDRKREVIKNLFTEEGLNLSTARAPIAASDYAVEPYSYNETSGDYDMNNFSIAQDEKYLIPYIKLAMEVRGEAFPIWSSPWGPPSWMKSNNSLINGGSLNEDDATYQAYALYFAKYIEEYKKAGINVSAVAPQNEPTMTTAYQSCVWTGEQLNRFIRDYLRPTLNEKGFTDTDIYLGTFTDANPTLAMPAIEDETTRDMIDGVCFQWWSSSLARTLYLDKNNTDLKFIQSETKCGDGQNNWSYAEAQFDCFKEFLNSGVSQYFLWNMVLDEYGRNTAYNWRQNAPINVHSKTNEIIYTPHYYLVKHFTNYIDGGARRIKTSGNYIDMIAFQNTDGENVLEVKNASDSAVKVEINFNGKMIEPTLKAHSINTFITIGEMENTEDATFSGEITEEDEPVQVRLTNKQSGLLLTVKDASFQDNAHIIQSSNHGEANQIWELVDKGDNYSTLASVNGYKVVHVWGTSSGDELIQYGDENREGNQHWCFVPVETDENGQTYYAIVKRNSELVIAMPSNEDGARAQQQTFTGNDNQLWKLDFIMGESNFKTKDMELEKLGSEISTADNLKAALGAGGEFTITDNLTVANAGVGNGVTTTGVIDGNGKTITKSTGDEKNALLYQNGAGDWTFRNLTIDGNKSNTTFTDACLWYMAGTVTFEDITVSNFKGSKETRFPMTNSGANIILNNVTFEGNENAAQTAFEENPGVNILNGTLTLNGTTKANIYYTGGTVDAAGLTEGCEVVIKADTADNYAKIAALTCANVTKTCDETKLTVTFKATEGGNEDNGSEEGDTIDKITSENELKTAFTKGGDYTVTTNFELANAGVDGGNTLTGVIDGAGNTITKAAGSAATQALLYQNGTANWTFKNFTFDGNKANITFRDAGMWYGGGSVEFENVIFQNFSIGTRVDRFPMTISSADITLNNVIFKDNEHTIETAAFIENPSVNILSGSLKLKGATEANIYYCGGSIDVSELASGCSVVIKADTEEHYNTILELVYNDENVSMDTDADTFTIIFTTAKKEI
ncbi:MAG: RICIN domain-containing protein [bacterium]|nr:RICIN domain-containing protein [bacterium]